MARIKRISATQAEEVNNGNELANVSDTVSLLSGAESCMVDAENLDAECEGNASGTGWIAGRGANMGVPTGDISTLPNMEIGKSSNVNEPLTQSAESSNNGGMWLGWRLSFVWRGIRSAVGVNSKG